MNHLFTMEAPGNVLLFSQVDAVDENRRLRTELNDLESTFASLNIKLSELKTKHSQKELDLESALVKDKRLKNRIKKTDTRIEILKIEIKNEKNEVDCKKKELDTIIIEKDAVINSKNEEMESLKNFSLSRSP